MYNAISSLLGNIELNKENDEIEITGVRSSFLQNDLRKLYGTNRVFDYMFDIETYSFRFKEFFLPDFLFIINEAINKKNRYGTPIHTLTEIRELILEKTWLNKLNKNVPVRLDRNKLKNFNTQPKDYQMELFDNYEKATHVYGLTGYLFAGAPGSGKTFTGLALTEMLSADIVICVVPKTSIYTAWNADIDRHFKDKQLVFTSDSGKEYQGEKFLIIHYEYLDKLIAMLNKLKYRKIVIILDESHNFNEIKILRTDRFLQLCTLTNCKDVLWLSGTPIKAVSLETLPLLRCIDNKFTPSVEERFRSIFRGDNNQSTRILSNRLGLISFKVEKERLGLEPPIFETIKMTFPGAEKYTLDVIKANMKKFIEQRAAYYKEREEEDNKFFYFWLKQHEKTLLTKERPEYDRYREYLNNIVLSKSTMVPQEVVYCNKYEKQVIMPRLPNKEIKDKFDDVRSVIKYVHLKIQGECLGRVVGRARVECHRDMASFFDYVKICESSEKKTIVFSSYVEVLTAGVEKSKKQELNPLAMHSEYSGRFNEIITKFRSEKKYNPLFATYAILSTAVPITEADRMILIDTPFRDYILQQAVSRIHRLGANTQTYVYTALLDTGEKPNISTRTVDILKWSQKQIEEILGIKSPFEIKDEDVVMEGKLIAGFEHDKVDYDSVWTEVFKELGILKDNQSLKNTYSFSSW